MKMHKLTRFWPYALLACIVLAIFYKVIFKGLIPFPGDLMLAEYVPWRHTSYSGYVAGAIPSKNQYFDTIRELYPWKTLVIDAYKNFQMPLWNPYNFSGTPLLANFQSQSLYPLGVLYLLLPQITAWTVLIILQPLLGSIFTYMFAKEIGLSVFAAISASLLFNFSGFANSWLEFNTVWHTMLWLPLLLYIIERSVKVKIFTPSHKIVFIFAMFSSITGGHPQDFIYTFLFFLIYTGLRITTIGDWSKKEKISYILTQLTPITMIPLLLAAPQILPTIELFTYSSRVSHDVKHITETMLIQWWQLPMLFIQDFFGNPATGSYYAQDTYVGKTLSVGIAGFILAFVGLFQKNFSWHAKFFLWTACSILVLTVNTPLTQIFYQVPLPILSTGTPTRILFLLAFALAYLGGSGLDYIKTLPWRKLRTPVSILLIILGLLWIVAIVKPTFGDISINPGTTKRALVIATGITMGLGILFFLKNIRQAFIYGTIGILVLELMYSVIKFNPFVPQAFIYPDNDVLTFLQTHAGINRYWGYGTARMESNVNAQYKIFSADGTDPLNVSWYNRFIQSSRDGNIAQKFNRSTRSDVAIAPGYGEKDLPDNMYRLRIMDLLGIQFILDRIDNPKDNYTFTADRFKPVFNSKDGYTIYENLHALPRAFLADTYNTYYTDAEFEKAFFNQDFDIKNTILLPKSTTNIPTTGKATIKDIHFTSYTPNEVTLTTNTDVAQFLFLSDTFAPGWHATVDNTPTPIYRANYAFRAIVVPPGTHTTRFYYYPRSFQLGIILFMIGTGFLLFVLFGLSGLYKGKHHKAE